MRAREADERQPIALLSGDTELARSLGAALAAGGFALRQSVRPRGALPAAWVADLREAPEAAAERLALLDDPARASRPYIALVASGDPEAGLAALKRGALDFLQVPFDPEELVLKLERWLAPAAAPAPEPRLRLVGRSPAIELVREQIARAGDSRAGVLITGETGTGKERVAALLHAASPRRQRRMIKVNCAALPDPLLESELFGHERGAFTGAEQERAGRFEEADGSTLFLDEIGDMRLPTQAKVLRALQEQEFERLGGARTLRVDVRVIAATNQDLAWLIQEGRFREDLYFRLDVVPIHLPPLRDRREDLPELSRVLLEELAEASARPAPCLTGAAERAIREYAWPGNIRELRNVLERAMLMGDGVEIDAGDLSLEARPRPVGGRPIAAEHGLAAEPEPAPGPGAGAAGAGFVLRLPPEGIDHREAERQLIVQALEHSNWVQKDAAALLRMTRRRLNYRIRRLGITHPSWRVHTGPAPAEGGSDVC